MTKWLEWTVPAVAAVVMTQPVQALQFSSIAQAQKTAFPGATSFVPFKYQGVWQAFSGSKLVGYFVKDTVIGKHLNIDYSVALTSSGSVQKVEILEYRESYGGEVHNQSWLAQFNGKTSASAVTLGKDISNISGATLSCRHVTEGVKKILGIYASSLRS